uniref:Uncharacterized protein n=1 Tax=Magallana gigas TaxID=29159 RepID=K1R6H1_MAGGI
MDPNTATGEGRELRQAIILTQKAQENYEDTVNAFSEQLREEKKDIEELMLHSLNCRVREKEVGAIARSLRGLIGQVLSDTRTKESECELAAHILVNKAIKTKVEMFVAQLEQYRQTEEEERDPGPRIFYLFRESVE